MVCKADFWRYDMLLWLYHDMSFIMPSLYEQPSAIEGKSPRQ